MVALRTLDRNAHEHIEDRRSHLVTIEMLGDAAIQFPLADFKMTDEIPGSSGQEAEPQHAIRIVRE